MHTFSTLLNLACGGALLEEDDGRARRMQLTMTAMLMSLAFAAIWGAAAGSRIPALALANLYKVPMVILLSSLSAVPAGMLWLESVERSLGRAPAPWRCWLVVDTALLEAGGLVGTLETGRPRSGVVVATALGFAGAVALLGAGIRGLARVARRERDDALLDRELKELRRGLGENSAAR